MNDKERKIVEALESLRDTAPIQVQRTKWFNAFKRHLERLKKLDKATSKKVKPKKKEPKKDSEILSLEDAHDEANRMLKEETEK